MGNACSISLPSFDCCTAEPEPEHDSAKDKPSTSERSGIEIIITAGESKEKSRVTAIGRLKHIITDSERASFGIKSDDDLKRAVEKYFGQKPDHAFLHSSAQSSDLYNTHGWPQVEVVLEPIKAQIEKVVSVLTTVNSETITNKTSKKAVVSTDISQKVSYSVRNKWTDNSSKVSVEEPIRYEFGIPGTEGDGGNKLVFDQKWGCNKMTTQLTPISTNAKVTVELNAGESAIVELCTSSCTMTVKVTYEAHLIGDAAVNYNSKYKDHQSWGLPIGEVLSDPAVVSANKEVGSANKVQIVEEVEVVYFSNAVATAKDQATMQPIKSHLTHYPRE